MARRMALTVVLFSGCVWCLALATRVESGEPAKGGFKPVAPVDGVMTGQGLVYKELQRAINTGKGPSRTKDIEHLALALAELSNVNIYHAEKDDYRNWATSLRDTSLALAAEADKKASADDGKMKEFLGTLDKTCNACHDAYQK